jgi:hypothetical protein
MKATYGFRATMTARPGKDDQLIDLLLSATTEGSGASENFASEQAKAFVARIVPLLGDELQYQDEVPVGGTFRG